MEETLQLPLTVHPIKRNNYLMAAIAASLLLHTACTVFMLTLPKGSQGSRSVTYIDLNLPQAASPAMTAPAARPAAKTPPVLQPPKPVEKSLPTPEAQPAQADQQKSAPAATAAASTAEKPVASTFGLGLSRGFFQSIHDGETLRTDVKEYYLAMLDGINSKWWVDKEFDKVRIEPVEVWITVARSGQVLEVRLLRSSGNPRYDKMVLAALAAVGPLPPLPATYQDDIFQAPLRLSPPLNLMS